MANFTKKSSIAALMIYSVAGMAAILYQKPASAWTKLCNRSSLMITVAYARRDLLYSTNGGKTSFEVSDDPEPVNVRGWWKLEPGECKKVNGSPAKDYCEGKKCYQVTAAYYANNAYGGYWGGDQNYCVKSTPFSRAFSSGGYGPPRNPGCPAGYYSVGFATLTAKKDDWQLGIK
jgi:uncharacterized membrane protein